MKILTLLIFLSFEIISFSQEIKDSIFQEFISYFTDESNAYIPKDFFLDNFNSVCNNQMMEVVDPQEIFVFDKSIICIIEIGFPWDNPVYDFYYIIFTKNGQILESVKFAGTNKDLEGNGRYSSYEIFGDSLMQVFIKVNDLKKYEQFLITEEGVERFFSFRYPSKKRKYPFTTERFVSEKELGKLSKSELDIMRNEIFADHGYIFKTKKWKDYFSQQEWYEPRYEDVTDKITIIEKINIEKILEIASLSPR